MDILWISKDMFGISYLDIGWISIGSELDIPWIFMDILWIQCGYLKWIYNTKDIFGICWKDITGYLWIYSG